VPRRPAPPAPAKPSDQLARGQRGNGACRRCFPFSISPHVSRPSTATVPLGLSPSHRPFRNSSLSRFFYIYIYIYIHICIVSIIFVKYCVISFTKDASSLLPATCAYVSIETGGNLPGPSVKGEKKKRRKEEQGEHGPGQRARSADVRDASN
jgi:hypothetical protein